MENQQKHRTDWLKDKAWYMVVLFALLLTIAVGIKCNAQTNQQVYDYCDSIGIKHPDIVTKQCMYETGHLKSDIYRDNNNLFGMKLARKRTTTATGSNRGFAAYTDWRSSIDDYKIWQDSYYKGGDYYQFLTSHGYSTRENYCETLKDIKTRWIIQN